MKRFVTIVVLFGLLLSGCRPLFSFLKPTEELPDVPFSPHYQIGPTIEPDAELEAYLTPYRNQLQAVMERRVTIAGATFTQQEIGYLTADMIRYRAAHESQEYIHLGLYDLDDVAFEFREGAVTRGHIHEWIPYNKTLVILKISGRQVTALANEIAQRGLAPVSGMRFTVSQFEARGILVDGGVVNPDSTYSLATTSTLAESGGGYLSLQAVDERVEYPILIRDIVVDYLADQPTVEPLLDQRIRSL